MAKTGRLTTKAEVIKRRRRDRQIIIFGVTVVVLGFLAFISISVYQGRAASPLTYAFVTPSSDAQNESTLPCPPTGEDALPMPADQISFRTLNATEESGLARTFFEDLTGRSFVGVQATNWTRKYEGLARITFGEKGLRQAYTIANQFPEYELVYDDRDSALVDIVLGDLAVDAELRPLFAPELAPDLELTASGQCVPLSILFPEPGPARLPEDPLAPEPTVSPSPSATPAA